jgi:hypothetical protein
VLDCPLLAQIANFIQNGTSQHQQWPNLARKNMRVGVKRKLADYMYVPISYVTMFYQFLSVPPIIHCW